MKTKILHINLSIFLFYSSRVSLETHHHLKLINMRRLQSDGLSLKYDLDGEYLAIGCKNGTKLLYDLSEGKLGE